jgi:type II secretory pathway component PulK
MRRRRGFALITALWLMVALSTVGALSLATARAGAARSRYRLTLRRAEWAREACAALLVAHYEAAHPDAGVDSTDLGRDVWCRATVTVPAARLNINRADRAAVQRLFHSDALTDALLDWRDADDDRRAAGAESAEYAARGQPRPRNGPLHAVEELSLVAGFDTIPIERLRALVTTRGDGRLDINRAPLAVLATQAWLDAGDLALLDGLRRAGTVLPSVEEWLGRLGRSRREALGPVYPDLLAALVATAPEVEVVIEGGVGRAPARAWARLTAVALPERLAVVRREVW